MQRNESERRLMSQVFNKFQYFLRLLSHFTTATHIYTYYTRFMLLRAPALTLSPTLLYFHLKNPVKMSALPLFSLSLSLSLSLFHAHPHTEQIFTLVYTLVLKISYLFCMYFNATTYYQMKRRKKGSVLLFGYHSKRVCLSPSRYQSEFFLCGKEEAIAV